MSARFDEDRSRASSENDDDEEMEDLAGGDAEEAQDQDGEGQNEEDNQDALEDDDEQDEPDESPTRPQARRQPSHTQPNGIRGDRRRQSLLRHGSFVDDTSASPYIPEATRFVPTLRHEMVMAGEYDLVPTIAAPQGTSINAVTATPDMRWVFSGGADGWVRKFNWVDTVNGKLQLTVAQRHPFVDSVQKAGILHGYWENEPKGKGLANTDGPILSPIYSLAVQHQALWLLAGSESGAINISSVRHDEGKHITSLNGHKSAVSVLSLSADETSLLSGSWDKTIIDWDLSKGQAKRSFTGSGGQISAIEIRPVSSMPVPRDFTEPPQERSDTFMSDSNDLRKSRGSLANGAPSGIERRESAIDDNDSLFGGGGDDNDSLFGDKDNDRDTAMGFEADDEDKDYSAAFNESLEKREQDAMNGTAEASEQVSGAEQRIDGQQERLTSNKAAESPTNGHVTEAPIVGSPQADDTERRSRSSDGLSTEQPPGSENIFLDAATNGTIRIWDRRQASPVARMLPSRGTPPWCMHACWSQDGNAIYAGRRNGTVDEYCLHKGLKEPHRQLSFPSGSGAVSAVRAMPNSKHLLCASYDILRLYDLKVEENTRKSSVPFQIVPGHRTGVVSQLYIDPTGSFLISTGGNRGYFGDSTEVLLGYEIMIPGR